MAKTRVDGYVLPRTRPPPDDDDDDDVMRCRRRRGFRRSGLRQHGQGGDEEFGVDA